MKADSPITTHVLDTSLGRPAAGIAVILERLAAENRWQKVGDGVTDLDGRVGNLLAAGALTAGRYRLTFAVDKYFQHLHVSSFYPQVTVDFQISAPAEHYHVPLLLSPFGFSTYRGS